MSNGSVGNGYEALRVLRQEATDGNAYFVAILDLEMPEMDGLTLARKIKSDAEISSTRLLMMVPPGRRDDVAIREAGVEICLTKPVKQSQLFDCLATLVGSEAPPMQAPIKGIKGGQLDPALATRERLRILVAEDNIVNQKVALRQLQRIGYNADAVANGLEVLEALERIPYDVVLMDCQMPEMDGYEATKEIRRRQGHTRHTTIIAMTANALERDRERCIAAGMDDYISKPVKQADLSAVLEPWAQAVQASDIARSTRRRSVTVLDRRVIAELRDLSQPSDTDFFTHLIDLFIEETPRRLEAMRAALDNRSPEVLAREAHALKGSCAHLGATRMDALCEIVEEQGLAGNISGLSPLVSVLEEEYDRVSAALEAEKNRLIKSASKSHQESS